MVAGSQGIRIGDWLRLSAKRFPDRLCFIDEGEQRTLTFAETNFRVNQLANALLGAGVRPGDTLAVLGIDSHRYMETLLASMKLGTTYVPLNYRLVEREIQTLVGAARSRWIFVSERYADLAMRLRDEDGHPLRVVCYDGDVPAADGFEAFISSAGSNEPDTGIEHDDEEILGLAFTSGTTGLPKGVLRSQRMIKSMVLHMMSDYAVSADDCRYSAAPMFHISGMAMIFMG